MLDHHHFATLNELIYLGIDHQSWVANILKETTRSYVLSDKKKSTKSHSGKLFRTQDPVSSTNKLQ